MAVIAATASLVGTHSLSGAAVRTKNVAAALAGTHAVSGNATIRAAAAAAELYAWHDMYPVDADIRPAAALADLAGTHTLVGADVVVRSYDFVSRDVISDLTTGWVAADPAGSVQAGEPVPAGTQATNWYEWTAPTVSVDSVTFTGSWVGASGASLSLYTGDPGAGFPPTLVTQQVGTGSSGALSVSFVPVPSQTYYLQYGSTQAYPTGLGQVGVETVWVPPAVPPVPTDPSALGLQYRALMRVQVDMAAPTLVDGVPQAWGPTAVSRTVGGMFLVTMGQEGSAMTDVTFFRGVPVELSNYSYTDPFSYASAVINFPQITAFDNLDALGFLGTELNPANVDIWYVPTVAGTEIINPLTQVRDLGWGTPQKVWEGFVASREVVSDQSTSSLSVQCQGALYQLDYYKQKPFYPRRPYVFERVMYEVMYPFYDPAHPFGKPHLRTLPLDYSFPAGWKKVVPPRKDDEPNLYTPVIPPGRPWTGYTTRNTGSWENTLTGYLADILAAMFVPTGAGVPEGNQFTLRCYPGRQPKLEIRDQARPVDFAVWVGTPGVTVRVSADFTQIENSRYGEGTDTAGTVWRNAHVAGAWNRTDYEPLARIDAAYPAQPSNASFDSSVMVHESKTNYGSGMELDQAEISSQKRIEKTATAGLSGSLTLQVDPAGLTRWQVAAGMTVLVKGLMGSGDTGVRFHIAEVVVNVSQQTVEAKIDTQYRDLLTLEEVRARTIDPLTPSKLLQVNKRSVMIEDVLAPWDYHQGSGYIPQSARHGKNSKADTAFERERYNFFKGKSNLDVFPWKGWLSSHPPKSYDVSADGFTKGPYVRVDASAGASKDRWSFVKVLTAQKGSIARTELVCVDGSGNPLPIAFHLSFHDRFTKHTYMPHIGSDYSPFQPDAFEAITAAGNPNIGSLQPPVGLLIGWGNALQKAGYWPGLSSKGHPATGLFVDDSAWTFDNTNGNLDQAPQKAEEGEQQKPEAITIYAAIYAEHSASAYFIGRLYKAEQGAT